jgi:GT2 family glycosyltransferase
MLREIGLFDDTYFLYYEDLDLSWRARFAGWKVHYEPKSIVLHEHAFSSVAGSHFFRFWVDRNRRLTLVKNAPTRDALLAVSGAVGLMLQDVTTEAFRSIRQGRLPLKFFSHRIRQLGSVIRALPKASRARWTARGQGQFRRQIVDEWIIDR